MTSSDGIADTPKTAGVLLAAFGDTHSGSTIGLMAPKRYQFRDGDVQPNKGQRALWKVFDAFTSRIAELRQGRRLIVVINGDLVDGDHHQTHQLTTRKASEQEALFLDVADHFLRGVSFASTDALYVLRGTDLNGTHGNAESADRIARDLGAVPEQPPTNPDGEGRARDGWYPWQNLDLDICGHLVKITHHPPAGIGLRRHTRGNGVRGWVRSYQDDIAARGGKLPSYFVWSHKHVAWSEPVHFDNGKPDGIITQAVIMPAFQLPSDFVYQKIPHPRGTTIGGWWASFDLDGFTRSAFEYVELDPMPKPERING